jgi:hypothetical protein
MILDRISLALKHRLSRVKALTWQVESFKTGDLPLGVSLLRLLDFWALLIDVCEICGRSLS